MTKTNGLKVAGYLSIAIALLILFNENVIGALPFIANAIFCFRYLTGKFKNKEAMLVFSIIMLFFNFIYFIVDDVWTLLDVVTWALLAYAWHKS